MKAQSLLLVQTHKLKRYFTEKKHDILMHALSLSLHRFKKRRISRYQTLTQF